MFRVDVTTDLVRGRAEAVLGPRFGRLVHVLAAVRGHGDWWVPPQADLRACLVGRRVCRSSVGCFLWDRLRPGGSCEPGESASFRARRFRRRRYGRPICRLGCARDRGGGIRCVRPWPLPCRLGRPRCLRRGAGGAGDQTAGLDDERGDLLRAPARVTASRKSHASSASAWKRRKPPTCQRPARVPGRSLASRRISGTDDATTFTTSTSNSPCTRRYPHWRFSRNSRSTRAWMEATARGRPSLRPMPGSLPARDQVRPADHRVRANQQPHPPQRLKVQPVQQRRRQCPVGARRTAPSLRPADIPAPQSDAAGPRSRRPYPDRWPEQGAGTANVFVTVR